MKIHIDDLKISCIVGIFDFEREAEQSVTVNMTMEYLYQKGNFVNYVSIVELIEKDLKSKKHELLEDALLSIQKTLFSTFKEIESMELKISKPDIMDNCIVSISKAWINGYLKS